MQGQKIIVSCEPKGRFEGVIVSGTPKPGTCMEYVPSINPISGRFTMRARTITFPLDGQKGPVCVLLADELQGGTNTQAYTSGRWGEVYWPTAGDDLNMLLRYQPGTGTALDENIGDLLEIDGSTGMLQGVGTGGATGSHLSAPFQLMEHLGVALTTNALVWVKYLGNGA